MRNDTAGDPITGLRWTRKTTENVASALRTLGIMVSARTVAKLLGQMGYSLRVNYKKRSSTAHPQRDAQFARIAQLRQHFAAKASPIISVDTKKKELVGQFKNSGVAWNREPEVVNDHDFRSCAEGIAIPYGIYDLSANQGALFVGTTRDTPQFAVDAIETWWHIEGLERYPHSRHLAILADGGGSNSSSSRAWKYAIQHRLCNRHGLSITVAHYPPGASKWNPIEHRLFSEISKHWAGKPLDSYETILNYIRTTKTKTGLRVSAHLVRQPYEIGVKISDAQMRTISVVKHEPMPKWNYTVRPQ